MVKYYRLGTNEELEYSRHWVEIMLDQNLSREEKRQSLLNNTKFMQMLVDIDWIDRFIGLDDGTKLNELKEALGKFYRKTCIDRNAFAKWSQISAEINELNKRTLKQFEIREQVFRTFRNRGW